MRRSSSTVLRAVQFTTELQRVVDIPRRVWTEEEAIALAEQLTPLLALPGGKQRLRPIQAQALYEAWACKGLFAPIRVGGGKTLLSFLVAVVLSATRPLLLLPAGLIEKTRVEQRILSLRWRIPNFLRIESYELLGHVGAKNLLTLYRPDLVILDEAHKLKNPAAAVSRRVKRFFEQHPQTMCVAMSGTITKRSILDFAHLLDWCLPAVSVPLPLSYTERVDWSDALDEKLSGPPTCAPGALRFLGPGTPREAFQKRLTETLGVVASRDGYGGSSLVITPFRCTPGQAIDGAFAHLRDAWETPDEYPISDALTLKAAARELALGFYSVWSPRPPDRWMNPRRLWNAACRYILRNNRSQLDSPLEVAKALHSGYRPFVEIDGEEIDPLAALRAWKSVEKSFVPNPVPVWLDDAVLEAVRRWAGTPGIIWTEHVAFALELAHRTGLTYYGQQGLDDTGQFIENARNDKAIIASRPSNDTGRNLQYAWSRNLVIDCPKSGAIWEQLLGRTHRDGQPADEVTCEVLMTCKEHVESFAQALADAEYIQTLTNQSQKLLSADVSMPQITEEGPRWG